jgi:hypothetical protein
MMNAEAAMRTIFDHAVAALAVAGAIAALYYPLIAA